MTLLYFIIFLLSICSRPIAGHANLCPDSISTKTQELETLLSTVKHEILHALGFSVSLYAFYRDQNGEPRTPRRAETGKPPLNEKCVIPLHLQLSNFKFRIIISLILYFRFYIYCIFSIIHYRLELWNHLFFGDCLNSLHFNYIRVQNSSSEKVESSFQETNF